MCSSDLLLEELDDLQRQIKALPAHLQAERVGVALNVWINGLYGETKFRRASQRDLSIEARRMLLREAMKLFADCNASIDKVEDMIDQNSAEIVGLVRSGVARSRDALAKLEK